MTIFFLAFIPWIYCMLMAFIAICNQNDWKVAEWIGAIMVGVVYVGYIVALNSVIR